MDAEKVRPHIDLRGYEFSIIYGIDTASRQSLEPYTPPDYAKLRWSCTERGPTEFDYLGGSWRHGRHRKHCNILNFEQFCDFLDHVGLVVEQCHTMGSLGAPGFGISWAPAVPFRGDDESAIQSAYVTPIPPEAKALDAGEPLLPGVPEDIRDLKLPDWDAVEQAMWEWFENGGWDARNREA